MIATNIVLFSVLFLISCVIVRRLWIAQDGKLRKIMIFIFLCDAWINAGFILVQISNTVFAHDTAVQFTLAVLFLPKTIAKLWFYDYVKTLPR